MEMFSFNGTFSKLNPNTPHKGASKQYIVTPCGCRETMLQAEIMYMCHTRAICDGGLTVGSIKVHCYT